MSPVPKGFPSPVEPPRGGPPTAVVPFLGRILTSPLTVFFFSDEGCNDNVLRTVDKDNVAQFSFGRIDTHPTGGRNSPSS